jgi:hypothetical protein
MEDIVPSKNSHDGPDMTLGNEESEGDRRISSLALDPDTRFFTANSFTLRRHSF